MKGLSELVFVKILSFAPGRRSNLKKREKCTHGSA